MPDGDYTKFCRSGKQRRPEMHVRAVTKDNTVRFTSDLGWRNYQAAMADHDPADAEHYARAFVRYIKDTADFRKDRKAETTRHRATAHCHKAHWLMARKSFDGDECLMFPSMVVHRPEKVKYNLRTMSAARAMLLMTQGLPKDEAKTFATHICGNGHLSCVNPKHLAWGSPADNARDAVVHNAPSEFIAGMDPDMVAQIKSSPEMVKVIAWRTGIPAGVVSAIRLGEQFAA